MMTPPQDIPAAKKLMDATTGRLSQFRGSSVSNRTSSGTCTVCPLAPERSSADGYHKLGPGPMAAIRFKWSVRRDDDGEYYVDETIGENSLPVVSGPMSAEEAVRLVDDRETEARQRFDALRSEMAGRGAAVGMVRRDGGEI